MAQSPLRRNRRFERIAVPILLVLLVVVLGRQLRAATSANERCEIRVERSHDHPHARHLHSDAREVKVNVFRDMDRLGHHEVVVHVDR